MQPQLLLIDILLRLTWSIMNKFEAVILISPEASNSILTDNIKSFEPMKTIILVK